MDSSPSVVPIERRAWFWLAAALVLSLFANGRWLVPIAAWIAPLCFLHFLHLAKPLPGLLLGGIGAAAVTIITWVGMIPLDDNSALYCLVFFGSASSFGFRTLPTVYSLRGFRDLLPRWSSHAPSSWWNSSTPR